MNIYHFTRILSADFYTGVPDSQLKPLCDYLMSTYGTNPQHHMIAANEGNAVAIAAGYHLATGKIPVVYLQNSGEGNIINPVASLLYDQVYAIPVIFIIGWRGEPGVHDEPQHIFQGQVTVDLLRVMGIESYICTPDTTESALSEQMVHFREVLATGKCVAFVIRKGALTDAPHVTYQNAHVLMREEIIQHIVAVSGDDPIISTTGKASRELFETREANGQEHKLDFLTVGSMGHSSSIALSIALHRPETRIWCIDGDGAAIMHMGAMAIIGQTKPHNLVHILINNASHESVGGMPTAGDEIDFVAIARACGYPSVISVDSLDALDAALQQVKQAQTLAFLEVKCKIGARANLGRPTTSALENKEHFMAYLQSHGETANCSG